MCSVYRILSSKTILSLQQHTFQEKIAFCFVTGTCKHLQKGLLLLLLVNGELRTCYPGVPPAWKLLSFAHGLPKQCHVILTRYVAIQFRACVGDWLINDLSVVTEFHKVSFNCLFNKKYIPWNGDECITVILAAFSNLSLSCKQTLHLKSKQVFFSG